MFRWFLMIALICPCPCQWIGNSAVYESDNSPDYSCCQSCNHGHYPKPEPNEPCKKCPFCKPMASVPPDRVSWDNASGGSMGELLPAMVELADAYQTRHRQLATCAWHDSEGPRAGREMRLMV